MELTDIDQMPAGREMDALVAERVMGWELLSLGYVGTESETQRQRELSDWMERVELTYVGSYWIDVATDFWIEVDSWHPSQEDAPAFQVVDKMIANGWRFSLSYDPYRGEGKPAWRASFCRFGGRANKAYSGQRDEAICRAALKAKEAERAG